MDMQVYIKSVDGNQMAAKISGTFSMGEHTFDFTAIAFGRIGGHNVGAKLSKKTVQALKSLNHNPDTVIDTLQRNLVHGNLRLPEGLSREDFADS